MNVLILGSGPNVVQAADWPRGPFDVVVAINNAWRVRDDWDYLIHPSDFPQDRQPRSLSDSQKIITYEEYVPANNAYGGILYAGGTMAFTAGYWVLAALRPRAMAFLGCDMTYSGRTTHFYGKGTADPLRADVSLRSLEAKSARLQAIAAAQGCATLNLSCDDSRLVFPRATPEDLSPRPTIDATAAAKARALEDQAAYVVPSGKYWKEEDRFDVEVIDAIDAAWLATLT